MARDAAEVLKDALSLPTEARAVLVGSLLDSLEVEVDEDAEDAWRREIHKRVEDIDRGAVNLVPWEDVEQRLRTRLRQ